MNSSGPSAGFWLAWHSVAAIAIAVLPSRIRIGSIWGLSPDAQLVAGGLAVAYVASVAVVAFRTRRIGRIRLADLVSAVLPVLACLFLFLLLRRPVYPRSIILLSLVLLVTLVAISPLTRSAALRRPALAIVASIVVLSLVPGRSLMQGRRSIEPSSETKIVQTSLHSLVVRSYRDPFGPQEVTGGGIAEFGDGYLVAMGDGHLHAFVVPPGGADTLQTRKLPHRVPLNRDEFERDAATHANVNTRYFRTADILVRRDGEDFRLFASHHHWDVERKCFTVRVSATGGSIGAFLAAHEPHAWQTVYETEPCLPFKGTSHPFAGHQIGGKLAHLDGERLVLIVGDHEYDGVHAPEMLPQDTKTSYGKTILLDLRTRAASTYSTGHRNPQGLHVDSRGNVWATEHGPKGGDELNLILKGRNYGWPIVTYGRDYERGDWPLNPQQGRHEGFEAPVQAWMPSIGISDLIRLRGDRFSLWTDDLLVSSLKNNSIWRVRIEQEKVVYAERIHVDHRIRDMIEDKDGRLVLWTEKSYTAPTRAAIVIVEPIGDATMAIADPAVRGELSFAQCAGCHGLKDGDSGFGPDLRKVVGRRVAAREGYTYSEALKSVPGTWTEERLNAFLTDPQKFAPGTTMQSDGVRDAMKRADLIEYLKTLK